MNNVNGNGSGTGGNSHNFVGTGEKTTTSTTWKRYEVPGDVIDRDKTICPGLPERYEGTLGEADGT